MTTVTLKTLQKPQIIEVNSSLIRIAHPDISGNIKSQLRGQLLAAGTAMTVADNNGVLDDDILLVGKPGDPKTEEVQVNGSPTRGPSITVENTLKFDHELDDPVTKIFERKITLYGSATNGGSLTAIRAVAAAVSIQWENDYTEIPLITTDTTYAYYVAKFYDGTTESAASDYIPSTGLPENSAEKILQRALTISGTRLDEVVTRKECVDYVNKAQNEILFFSYQDPVTGRLVQKNWDFEEKESVELTVTVNDNEIDLTSLAYLPKHYSGKSFIMVQIGTYTPLSKVEPKDMDYDLVGTVRTAVKTEAHAGDTSIAIDSNVLLPDSGTIYVGDDTITYTGKTGTDTLTGVPASGSGSITATHIVDTAVWYGSTPSIATKFCIKGTKMIFDKAISSDYENYVLRIRYFYKLTSITEACDNTDITCYDIMYNSVAEKIQLRKGNKDEAVNFKKLFRDDLLEKALANEVATSESYKYYQFETTENE